MELPKLEFWFDYCGACVWVNGGAKDYDKLPISESLKRELGELCTDYDSQLDWDDPGSSAGWTKEQEDDFHRRAAIAGKKLQEELRGKYTVINFFEKWL